MIKFIVDAQLPKRLSDLLKRNGYDSIHTLELPDKNNTKDSGITNLAINEGRVVISKDLDFLESFLVYARPKKLLIVKTGNINNTKLLQLFESNIVQVCKFFETNNLIEIHQTEIVLHD